MSPAGPRRAALPAFGIAVAGLLAIAFLLRVLRIGAQEVWNDEAFSYFLATGRHWLGFALVDSTPPLYYALLRAWAALAGSGEAALRLLSAVLGTAFVGVTVWTGSVVLDRRAGLLAAAFAAIAPMHVYYSQEARHYALLVLLAQALLGLVWKALDGNEWRSWAAVAACSAAVLYTHYFGAVILAALLLLPAIRRDRGRLPRQAAAFAAAGLAVLPWVVANLRTKSAVIGGGSPIGWIAEVWSHTPPLWAIPKSLLILGLGSHRGLVPLSLKQMSLIDVPGPVLGLGAAVLAALFVAAAVGAGDRETAIPGLGARKASLFALLFAPLAALWIASFVRPLYVAGRFDLVAFPAYVLIVGLGLAKLAAVPRLGPRLASVALVLLLIPIAVELDRYYTHEPSTRRHQTAAAVRERVRPGDAVVFTGLRGMATLYYLERLGIRWEDGVCVEESGTRFGCRLFPRATERVLAASTLGAAPSPDVVRGDVDDYLSRLGPPPARLWLVLDEPSDADALLSQELKRRGFAVSDGDRALRILGLERAEPRAP